MNFIINKNIEYISDYISSIINREINLRKKVIWFVSGGSVVPIEVLISKKIKRGHKDNLFIVLGDERYGEIDHRDSNWLALKKSGFDFDRFNVLAILYGRNFSTTAKDFRESLNILMDDADYKIGMFGIGSDGHTSGILPHSEAVNIDEYVCYYETPQYNRITITPKVMARLDEAFVYAVGKDKWDALSNLNKEIPTEEEPAQSLKKVSSLTIFTDYQV